jgi:hypothetical protein
LPAPRAQHTAARQTEPSHLYPQATRAACYTRTRTHCVGWCTATTASSSRRSKWAAVARPLRDDATQCPHGSAPRVFRTGTCRGRTTSCSSGSPPTCNVARPNRSSAACVAWLRQRHMSLRHRVVPSQELGRLPPQHVLAARGGARGHAAAAVPHHGGGPHLADGVRLDHLLGRGPSRSSNRCVASLHRAHV